MRLSTLLLSALVASVLHAQPAPLHTHALAVKYFGNDSTWYERNIPFFEISDPQIQEIYYYRWKVLRAHMRDIGSGQYIFTEFLDDVAWDRDPYSSTNDPVAFQIADARWLQDRSILDGEIRYMYAGGGNDRHFSESIADAVYGRYLADANRSSATEQLASMISVFRAWDDHYTPARRLYWIEPLADATEYTISSIDASGGKDGFRGGEAFRPSINSFQYGNARAIANISRLAGMGTQAQEFERKAADLRAATLDALWSPALGHFVDRHQRDTPFVHTWTPIGGRELVGYTPWFGYGTLGLADGGALGYVNAWQHLLNQAELGGHFGMRTAEPDYRYYMLQYRYDKETAHRECQWNGPAWPFQTTQTLNAFANLLNGSHAELAEQKGLTKAQYLRLLRQYTALHYPLLQDGARTSTPDIQEDYDPDTGHVIVGMERSHHYSHSGYNDLVLTGLVGVRPRSDNVLEIHPLIPDNSSVTYFAVQDLPYHGHALTVLYDRTGQRYRRGRGMIVFLDGKRIGSAPRLEHLALSIPPPIASDAPPAPVNLAVNLRPSGFPSAAVSVNPRSEEVYSAHDGRAWFFPEMPRGWTAPANSSDGADWYTIDFGSPATIGSATLDLWQDSITPLPQQVTLQVLRDKQWLTVASTSALVANGPTHLDFPTQTTTQLRVVFRHTKPVRLVELGVYAPVKVPAPASLAIPPASQ